MSEIENNSFDGNDYVVNVFNDLLDLADVDSQKKSFLEGHGRIQRDLVEFLCSLSTNGLGATHYQFNHAERVLGLTLAQRLDSMWDRLPDVGYDYDKARLWDDPNWQSLVAEAQSLLKVSPFKELYEKYEGDYAPNPWMEED